MAAVASRYARALAEVVFADKLDATKTLQDLEQLAQLLKSSADLRFVWESPAIAPEDKSKLLDSVAAQAAIARQVRNFVGILIDNRRLKFLPEIATQLRAELNERLGLADAAVVSARALDDSERKSLETQISKVTGRTVRARYEQDKTLLGGAVVKVGSTIFDGSVRGQLQRIKAQIAGQ
jgi:F-type H+-transporting ATPase subunit delta